MKRFIALLLTITMALSLAACGAANNKDTYKVRLSCDTVDDSTLTIYLKKFAEEAERLSNGRVQFEIYTNGSLYKGVAGLEATQNGDLEMCLCALSNYGELSQKIFLLSLPFVFPTNQAVYDAYSGDFGKLAVEDAHDYNLELLSYFVFGGTDMSSSKQIKVPDDVKGQKIRVFGLANSSFITNCGGAPTFMSGGEVTQSLSTGLIDGALTGAESMVERKYYEFQDYLCAIGFERADQMVVMNYEWWQKLPAEIQGYISQAMENVREEEWKTAAEQEEAARKTLEEMGMVVYYPTSEEMKLWYDTAEKVYDEFREILGDELVDKAIAFRNSYSN